MMYHAHNAWNGTRPKFVKIL